MVVHKLNFVLLPICIKLLEAAFFLYSSNFILNLALKGLLESLNDPIDWMRIIIQLFSDFKIDLSYHAAQIVQSMHFVAAFVTILLPKQLAEPGGVAEWICTKYCRKDVTLPEAVLSGHVDNRWCAFRIMLLF